MHRSERHTTATDQPPCGKSDVIPMPAPDETPPDADDFDPDTLLWSPGVDYVAGWRDATNAAAELRAALETVGIDTTTLKTRTDTTPDGTGLLHLTLPASTARQLTVLARVAATRLRQAG
jgi:hypothetical protein